MLGRNVCLWPLDFAPTCLYKAAYFIINEVKNCVFFPMARKPLLSTTLSTNNQQQKLKTTIDNRETND